MSTERLTVRIRGDNGALVQLSPTQARLRRLALHWAFLLRNRRRWIDDPQLDESIADRSREHLYALGVSEQDLIALARASVIEVSHDRMDSDPDLRLMPWEGFLIRATRPYRDHGSIVVYRLVQASNSPIPANDVTDAAVYIESYPGKLRRQFTFDEEREAFATYARGFNQTFLKTPTMDEVRIAMNRHPGLIHLTAIDSVQGAKYLPNLEVPKDGVWMRDTKGTPIVMPLEEMTAALCAGNHRARLVALNFNNSSRLAGYLVPRCTLAAVGFQDFVDEDMAEIIFANLYDQWANSSETHLLEAFKAALAGLHRQLNRVKGSGITLWSARSLIDPMEMPITGFRTPFPLEERTYKVDIRACETLNYSVMHNGRKPIFERFCIYRYGPPHDAELQVRVALQWGGETSEFTASFQMPDHLLDLSTTIRLNLTSALARSLREAVFVTLGIHVHCGSEELYLNTIPVKLVAIDEWIDDEANGPYLPSFVLPRDPKIPGIVSAAQRYLMALADNPVQGFDGYQSTDGELGVEPQVRAIWYALQNDFGLRYVNPPPSFTLSSQRLRTPTEVIDGGRGTCLDLVVLLAACLESIGLHPVIFLLKGHASVGYWTREDERAAFLTARNSEPLSRSEDLTPLPNEQDELEVLESTSVFLPWHFDQSRWASIIDALDRGSIVPIETTYLTAGRSFADAVEAADYVLRQQQDFDCMLEITLARSKSITPLPIAYEGSRR